jgi:hypothetical protein
MHLELKENFVAENIIQRDLLRNKLEIFNINNHLSLIILIYNNFN